VYDKTVRRRRAVLALLVAVSLVLLTAYFGESSGGALHGVQRAANQVLSPVQEGANRALKPFRDLAGWFGDTVDAKNQRDKLEKENKTLRAQAIAAAAAERENRALRKTVEFDSFNAISAYAPLTSRVIGRSPTVWYSTVTIDKGSGSGVRADQPVIDGDGLVGRVSNLWGDGAQVTLITDRTSGVAARVNETGVTGVVKTSVGNPDDLLLDFVPSGSRVSKGQTVVTSGTSPSPSGHQLPSLFPPDIPIGKVTRVEQRELNLYQRVHIKPFSDLRGLDFVQVLTKPHAAQQQAKAP
jgi:rod shape-determining protein MreC